MKIAKSILFILCFLLFIFIIIFYYTPSIPTDFSFGYDAYLTKYYGPQGAFEALFYSTGSSYEFDGLLLFIELLGTLIFSIFISSLILPYIPDKKILKKSNISISVSMQDINIKDELIRNSSLLIFLLCGIIIYFGLLNRTITFNRLDGLFIIIAFAYSSYNIFYYGLLIHYRNTSKVKQVILIQRKYYELRRLVFLSVNFKIFVFLFVAVFFFCVKNFYKTDKFDLVDHIVKLFKESTFNNLLGCSMYFMVVFLIINLTLMFNRETNLTEKLLQTKFVRSSQ